MKPDEMWQLYTKKTGCDASYDAWMFGDCPDVLAQLVLSGQKTGTSSAYPLYEIDDEPLPKVGDFSIVLDGCGNAVCIIQTTNVYVTPFDQVTDLHAYLEGEGDRTLSYWRTVHRKVFHQWMEEAGLHFSEDMPVVCEEFVRVFP